MTNYLEILHDAVWYQGALPQKLSRGYYQNGGHKTTFLDHFLEMSQTNNNMLFVSS